MERVNQVPLVPLRWSLISLSASALLLAHSLTIWLGADAFLRAPACGLLGLLASLAFGWLVVRGSELDRGLGCICLFGLAAHLILLGPFLLFLPQSGMEIRSHLAGELGRTVGGFPLRALVELLFALTHSALLARLLAPLSLRYVVAALFLAVEASLVIDYASGGLNPFPG